MENLLLLFYAVSLKQNLILQKCISSRLEPVEVIIVIMIKLPEKYDLHLPYCCRERERERKKEREMIIVSCLFTSEHLILNEWYVCFCRTPVKRRWAGNMHWLTDSVTVMQHMLLKCLIWLKTCVWCVCVHFIMLGQREVLSTSSIQVNVGRRKTNTFLGKQKVRTH